MHTHFMIELDPDKQKGVYFCRRIVPEDGVDLTTLDQNWVKKLNRGVSGRGDIILRKTGTQIPKGFKLVEEVKNGQVLMTSKVRGEKAVHVCKKEQAEGFMEGMSIKWVPIDDVEQKSV